MESLLIVVGSQSGNSAMVAQTLKTRLEQLGIGVDMLPEDCADPSTLVGRTWVLVCCSTHGAGDVPDNLVALMNALEDQSVDLDGMAYGVIALGDRTYSDTFCGGGRRVDGLFSVLGAQRVGEMLEIDASTQPFADEVALQWLPGWLQDVKTLSPH
jgi:MioC protein